MTALTSYQAKAILHATVRRSFAPGLFTVDSVSGDRRLVRLRPIGGDSVTDTPVSALTSVRFAGDLIPVDEWRALH